MAGVYSIERLRTEISKLRISYKSRPPWRLVLVYNIVKWLWYTSCKVHYPGPTLYRYKYLIDIVSVSVIGIVYRTWWNWIEAVRAERSIRGLATVSICLESMNESRVRFFVNPSQSEGNTWEKEAYGVTETQWWHYTNTTQSILATRPLPPQLFCPSHNTIKEPSW